jgi:hypothetical protein
VGDCRPKPAFAHVEAVGFLRRIHEEARARAHSGRSRREMLEELSALTLRGWGRGLWRLSKVVMTKQVCDPRDRFFR